MSDQIPWCEKRPEEVGWYWFEGELRVPYDVKPGRYRVRVWTAYGMLVGLLNGHEGGWVLDGFHGRWSSEIPEPGDYVSRSIAPLISELRN